MKLLAGLFAVVLAGCASMTDIIDHQKKLYAPTPIAAGSTVDVYRMTAAVARSAFESSVGKTGNPIAGMLDAGIVAANHNCRVWMNNVSQADMRFEQGQGNLNVAKTAVGAILGAVKAPYDLITAYGIGSTAVDAYNANFATSVLGVADHDLQSKVREVMAARADELRQAAAGMSYPQAIDAIEAYAELCSPQAAKAMARSSLTSTLTRATPAGTISSFAK